MPEEVEGARAELLRLVDVSERKPPELGHGCDEDPASLLTGPGYDWHDTRKISDRLLLDYLLDDAPIRYYRAFAYAADLTRATWLQALEFPGWEAAMPAVIKRMNCETEQQAVDTARLMYPRLFAQASAALRLRGRGFAIDLYGSGLRLEQHEYARLCDLALVESTAIGAPGLFACLVNILEPCWRADFGRYVVSLGVNTAPSKDHPSMPLAYLYNLAIRVASQGTRRGKRQLSDVEYWELVTDICAISGVESFKVWEAVLPSGTTLIDFLSRVANFSFAFVLPQCDERELPRTLNGLFAWVDATIESRLGWSVEQAVAFWEATTSLLPGRGNICIPKNAVRVALGFPESTFEAMWTAFVHPPNTANTQVSLPFDATAVNAHSKPLVGLDDERAVVGLRSVSAPGWYEAVADALRTVAGVTDTDHRIGNAFEPLVRKCLSPFAPLSYGKFSSRLACGDVDAALDTHNEILLFELKKKPITRRARSGDLISVLLDLTKSVIKAQTQLAKIEYLLYADGAVELSGTGVLERRGRKVKRIFLSLHDYGVFHDHGFLVNFLKQLSGASLTAIGDSAALNIEAINYQLGELATWEARLSALGNRDERPQFVNSFFYSLDHVLTMIRTCATTQQLAQHLTFNERVFNGALDFYVEYERLAPVLTDRKI